MSAIINSLALWAAFAATVASGVSLNEAYLGYFNLPVFFTDVRDAWLAGILMGALAWQCWHLYFVTQSDPAVRIAKGADASGSASSKYSKSSDGLAAVAACNCDSQLPKRD